MFSEFFIKDIKALGKEWGIPNEVQLKVFAQYHELARQISLIPKASVRILELGSGYSTALLAKMADLAHKSDSRDIRITSIDIGFDLFESIDTEGKDRVECLCGTTVTVEEMTAFYDAGGRASLMGRSLAELVESAPFARVLVDDRKFNYLKKSYGLFSFEAIRQRLVTDDSFFSEVLDYYSNFGSLKKELDLIAKYPVVLTDELTQIPWDVIYFDSGELSTNVEFSKLSQSISQQGLFAFHDVWFPKSFKSWLPASAVAQSQDWHDVYIDETTSQGMYIASRATSS